MPIIKCPDGTYRIGEWKCMYKSRFTAEQAYKAYKRKKK